jgi:hypothetical protein
MGKHICRNCKVTFGERGNLYVVVFGTPMDNYSTEHCSPHCVLAWTKKLARERQSEPEIV